MVLLSGERDSKIAAMLEADKRGVVPRSCNQPS